MKLRLIIAALVAPIALTPASAHAQLATTCGWHFLEPVERPPTLAVLLARQEASPEVMAAVARLEAWYRGCDGTDARVAAFELRRLRSRTNSSDPQLRALIGIAELRGPDVQVPNALGVTLRPAFEETNAATEGVRLLGAVARETGWPEVAEELAVVMLGVRKPAHLRTVRDVLRDRRFADSPRLRALLVEVEVALDETQRAAARLPDDDDDALTLRARAVVASMRNELPRDYLPALAKADAAELHLFFDDVRLLLDASEEAEWAALPAAERAAWIRRKWEWRAMMAGIDVEQRIGEHHRRMKTALETYPRRGFRGSPPMNSMWLDRPGITKQPLDDRGLIYLRHGAPDMEVALLNTRPRWVRRQTEPLPAPVMAWRYGGTLADGGVFEFAKSDDRSDWFLIEPTPACPDEHVLTGGMAHGYTAPGDYRAWSERLRELDPARAMYYERCAMGSAFAAAHFLTERRESREQAADAMTTETAVPRYGRPLAGAVNLYGFRSTRGGELVAYFGIPGDSLTSRRVAAGEEYALRVRIAGGDATSQQVVQRDTLIRFVQPAPLARGSVASTALSLPLPAGSTSRIVLSVLNTNDTTQGQVMSGMRTIPAASGMVMSDIVVAWDRDGSLQRAGHALAPALGHIVAAGQQVRVYYELYGVAANAPLQVDIEVSPGEERSLIGMLQELIARRSAVAVQFREAAEPDAAGTLPTLRTIGLDVAPGRYELSVKVTNLETGAAVTGTTGIIILDGSRR